MSLGMPEGVQFDASGGLDVDDDLADVLAPCCRTDRQPVQSDSAVVIQVNGVAGG